MKSYYFTTDDEEELENFYAFLEETFTDPVSEQQATESLSATRMGNRSVEDH
ncbi:hypothetical protein Cpir12675_006998, partial [Ceratocystis pirilliformis]